MKKIIIDHRCKLVSGACFIMSRNDNKKIIEYCFISNIIKIGWLPTQLQTSQSILFIIYHLLVHSITTNRVRRNRSNIFRCCSNASYPYQKTHSSRTYSLNVPCFSTISPAHALRWQRHKAAGLLQLCASVCAWDRVCSACVCLRILTLCPVDV